MKDAGMTALFGVGGIAAFKLVKLDTSSDASVKRKRLMAEIDEDFREILIRQEI